MKVLTILGVRPQFVKHKIMSDALRRRGHSDLIIHTGQHYDDNMHALEIPRPEHYLDLRDEEVSRAASKLAHIVRLDRPDYVLVYGDAKSTYLGAMAAVKAGRPLVHVEAGLRSNDYRMKEELYRRIVDHISDYLFAPTNLAVKNLEEEEVGGKIYLSGDVMREACMYYKQLAPKPNRGRYMLITLHRAELVDNELELLRAVDKIQYVAHQRKLNAIWPMHPRTKKMLQKFHIKLDVTIENIGPINYLSMLGLINNAELVITDSGGVQREAHWLGTEYKVFRNETEWEEIDDGDIESPSNYIINALEGEL